MSFIGFEFPKASSSSNAFLLNESWMILTAWATSPLVAISRTTCHSKLRSHGYSILLQSRLPSSDIDWFHVAIWFYELIAYERHESQLCHIDIIPKELKDSLVQYLVPRLLMCLRLCSLSCPWHYKSHLDNNSINGCWEAIDNHMTELSSTLHLFVSRNESNT